MKQRKVRFYAGAILVKCTVWVVGAILLLSTIIYFWHIVVPSDLRWLDDSDLSKHHAVAITIVLTFIVNLVSGVVGNKK